MFIQKNIEHYELVETSKYLQHIKENLYGNSQIVPALYSYMLSLTEVLILLFYFIQQITKTGIEKLEVEFNFNELNALKTREAGCKSEYELTVFFFISLDMYKPLFTLKNKLIMISITYGRDWSLLVMMNFYIRHNSMRR